MIDYQMMSRSFAASSLLPPTSRWSDPRVLRRRRHRHRAAAGQVTPHPTPRSISPPGVRCRRRCGPTRRPARETPSADW
jgi:hypothetical protein